MSKNKNLMIGLMLAFSAVYLFAANFEVQHKTDYPAAVNSFISAQFRIYNNSGSSIAMSSLRIRYYYTKESAAEEQFSVDWAQVGNSNVFAGFGEGYVEISFNSSAGYIGNGGNSGDIFARINKTDWSPYDQSDDYSFAPVTVFTPNPGIELYMNGNVIWGSAPGGKPVGGTGTVSVYPSHIAVAAYAPVTVELRVNSGTGRISAYGLDFYYPANLLTLDTARGINGVAAGVDGFVGTVNPIAAGKMIISGFDTTGKGPGSDLQLVKIHYTGGSSSGTGNFTVLVNTLVDAAYNTIGNPAGLGGAVTVGTPPATPVPALPANAIVRCCVDTVCLVTNAFNCDAAGGYVVSAGSCYPNPCLATPTATPTPRPSSTATTTRILSPTASITRTVTRTGTTTRVLSPTASITRTVTRTGTATRIVSPTASVTWTPTRTASIIKTVSPVWTPSYTAVFTTIPSRTPSRTAVYTITPSRTPSRTATWTPTAGPQTTQPTLAPDDPLIEYQQIIELNNAHSQEVEQVLANVQLDYHGDYGTVLPDQYPVDENGITPVQAETQVRNELLNQGYEIIQLQLLNRLFSGRSLVEHRYNAARFFVWHEFSRHPVIVIIIIVRDANGNYYLLIRVWIQTCSNGAGYWADTLIPLIYYPFNRFIGGLYATPELLLPYLPQSVPQPSSTLDPSGTLQTIYNLNVAHRLRVQAILDNVRMDYHPQYGVIGIADYPVNRNGMTQGDAESWINTQFPGRIRQSITEGYFTGRALSSHLVNGRIIYAWHDFNLTRIITARVVVPDDPMGEYCYEWRLVWILDCTNGLGHWEWQKVRVPCDENVISIDYSVEGGLIRNNPLNLIQENPAGDVNGDNSIDVVDALMITQYYVGLQPAGFNTPLADVNRDGSISVVDSLALMLYSVGLQPSL